MTPLLLILTLSLLLNITCTINNIGKQVILNESAQKYGAVCLDGGPADFYFAQGHETKKYILFFQGGGWCFNEEECWSRREGSLGSIKNDPTTRDFNTTSFLQSNPVRNPLFYNWNKVFFRYCDGMSYSGDVTDPVINPHDSSQQMYYRGKRILNAFFKTLLTNYSMDKATDVVISGSSAGGLAVFLHSNYFVNNFFDLNQTKLVLLPAVGFFIAYNGYQGKTNWANNMEYIYEMQNISSSIIHPICFNNTNWNDSQCVFAQNIAGDIVVPTFIINSQYDTYQAEHILGTGTSNVTLLNEYGKNFTMILIEKVLKKNNMYGAFIDACYRHDGWNPIYWSDLYIDGINAATAFMQFYNGLGKDNNQLFWYKNDSYPCQHCCSYTMDAYDTSSFWPILLGILGTCLVLIFLCGIGICIRKWRKQIKTSGENMIELNVSNNENGNDSDDETEQLNDNANDVQPQDSSGGNKDIVKEKYEKLSHSQA